MPRKSTTRRNTTNSAPRPHPFPPGEVVELSWILKAGAITVGVALLCAFVLLSFVFSRTQWQFVLHPVHTVTATPTSIGLPFTEVHFAVDASGQPQLDGWWIPSDSPTDPTVLLLHNGDESIGGALPLAADLHGARLNVFVFDYRGYGNSAGQHPTEAMMETDANSALNYLTSTRAIPLASIVVYGNGLGASLATTLCVQHPQIAALILESPDGDMLPRVQQDNRTKLFPVRLLFHENFPLAAPLRTLNTPKLIITYNGTPIHLDRTQVSDPKLTVELPLSPSSNVHESLRRFLDSYVAHPPGVLTPHP
jgi:pimeloyl-ACP methyl ester carboxylesterase